MLTSKLTEKTAVLLKVIKPRLVVPIHPEIHHREPTMAFNLFRGNGGVMIEIWIHSYTIYPHSLLN